MIGAGAGLVYAIVVAAWGSVAATPSVSGLFTMTFFTMTLVAGLVAVPTGVALGAGFGIVFGIIMLLKVQHLVWVEASVVAVFGGIVLTAAILGVGGVSGAVLAWTGGPLLVGVPAAALHGYRLQRRIGGY